MRGPAVRSLRTQLLQVERRHPTARAQSATFDAELSDWWKTSNARIISPWTASPGSRPS